MSKITGKLFDLCFAAFFVTLFKHAMKLMARLNPQVLSIVCIGLFDDPANNSRFRIFVGTRTIALGYVTFGAFIIVCAAYLIGKGFRDT